jgi:hypothetical protein
MNDPGPLTVEHLREAEARLRAALNAAERRTTEAIRSAHVRHDAAFRLAHVRIFESVLMVQRVLDARSPARARRRENRGHRQRYKTLPRKDVLMTPQGMVCHPVVAQQLRDALRRAADEMRSATPSEPTP